MIRTSIKIDKLYNRACPHGHSYDLAKCPGCRNEVTSVEKTVEIELVTEGADPENRVNDKNHLAVECVFEQSSPYGSFCEEFAVIIYERQPCFLLQNRSSMFNGA